MLNFKIVARKGDEMLVARYTPDPAKADRIFEAFVSAPGVTQVDLLTTDQGAWNWVRSAYPRTVEITPSPAMRAAVLAALDAPVEAGPEPLSWKVADREVKAGCASGAALWVLLNLPTDRDRFHLKPDVWEGPGEYQLVRHQDGREVFVKIPHDQRSFKVGADKAPVAQPASETTYTIAITETQRQLIADALAIMSPDNTGAQVALAMLIDGVARLPAELEANGSNFVHDLTP